MDMMHIHIKKGGAVDVTGMACKSLHGWWWFSDWMQFLQYIYIYCESCLAQK